MALFAHSSPKEYQNKKSNLKSVEEKGNAMSAHLQSVYAKGGGRLTPGQG